jgi:hypothetical protein
VYVNAKVIPESGDGGRKRAVYGVNSSMIYLIHCKNLCKSNNVLPPSTTIKKSYIYYVYNIYIIRNLVLNSSMTFKITSGSNRRNYR